MAIRINDPLEGSVYHVPEGIYDVVPCFLIFLSNMYKWDYSVFMDFKSRILKERKEIEKCFDKITWKAEWIDNRYSWDGIYKWTETFTYDRFSDESVLFE